jgi:hypothetical protein
MAHAVTGHANDLLVIGLQQAMLNTLSAATVASSSAEKTSGVTQMPGSG